MKKKDITENEVKVYDCWELAELSVKSQKLYECLCSLEAKENAEPFVKKIDSEEGVYQFYYAIADSCSNSD